MTIRDASKTNRNFDIGTSPATPTTFAYAIQWVQAIGNGNIVMLDESGNTVTFTAMNDREAIQGPFTALVSFTTTRVRLGDGIAPEPVIGSAGSPVVAGSGGIIAAISVANQATLTGLAQTVDGVALSTAGMRVYLAKQTTGSQQGIWVVQSGAWTRPSDWATGAAVPIGTSVSVAPSAGSNYKAFGSTWYTTAGSIVDTDTITAYPAVCKGQVTLSGASPGIATASSLWISDAVASGVAIANLTTAANGTKVVVTAGASSGSLAFTGPNSSVDVISYTVTNNG